MLPRNVEVGTFDPDPEFCASDASFGMLAVAEADHPDWVRQLSPAARQQEFRVAAVRRAQRVLIEPEDIVQENFL